MGNIEASFFKISYTCKDNLLLFDGLLQDHLLPRKFGGDITWTKILLDEIGNHLLSILSKLELKLHKNPSSTSTIISERDSEILQYITGPILHKLCKEFKLCKREYSCNNIILKN